MRADDLAAKPKKDLLELARKLGIAGRSAMSKEDLARAIAKASPSSSSGSKVAEGGRSASAGKSSAKKPTAKAERPAKSAQPARPAIPAKPAVPVKAEAPARETHDRIAERPTSELPPRESAPPAAPPVRPAPPSVPPPPPARPAPQGEGRPPMQGWKSPRPPREGPQQGHRRGYPPQDPALKLSRVEEIRRSSPGRPQGKPGRPGQGPGPRDMRQPGRDGRPGDRRGDRFQQKGGRHRGGMDRGGMDRGGMDRRNDRREGMERRNDPHSIERSLQAREHLRRSGEARRNSGYTRDSERPREARPSLEPPRPAAIPEHLARVVSPPPPPPPPRPDLEERTGHPLELPEAYGADRIVLLVRDPYWLHAYWEVTPGSINRVRSQIGDLWDGHRWLLRMHTHPHDGGGSGGRHFDIDLNPAARNWYVQVPDPNCSYEAMIGILTRDGTFHPFARSNRVRTPRDKMSDVLDVEWASTAEQWKQIYALSGGPTSGLASGSSAELGESMQERMKESWFSGMLGSMGSGALAAQRHRGFWFQVNTELVLYGATEPDAQVKVQGRDITLRPDGTFTLRFQLPDGVQEIPCVATSADGISERTITPVVRRQTTSSEREKASTKDPEI